jgi:hypothetical protein
MADPHHRIAIVVAVIGVVGTLGAALLANWDKVFGHSAPAAKPAAVATPAAVAPPIEPPRQVPTLSGNWRDSGGTPVTSRITQAGSNFEFSRQGSLPNGVSFTASGSGTLDGRAVTSHYRARYSHGAVSSGTCAGSLSADALRMDMRCSDSLLGEFSSVAVRE